MAYAADAPEFAGELDRHEAALRELWGGALCVSGAEHSERELQAIQSELMADPEVVASWRDTMENAAAIQVFVDDGIQERVDDSCGPGVVRVEALLQPVE